MVKGGGPRCPRAGSTAEAGLLVACRAGLDDLVDQPELLRLHRRQELVALDRGLDHLERLPGMLDVDLVEPSLQPEDLTRLDLDDGSLALSAAGGLGDHDAGIWQRDALAGRACCEPKGAHRGGLAVV